MGFKFTKGLYLLIVPDYLLYFPDFLKILHENRIIFVPKGGLTFCWSLSGSRLFSKVVSRRQKLPIAGKEWFDS